MKRLSRLSRSGFQILLTGVLVVFAGTGGYVIGRDNAEAQALSLNQMSFATSVYLLIDKMQIEKAQRLLDQQIDCGIIAAVRVRHSPYLFPKIRRDLDESLGRSFVFRENHSYVLIDTNSITRKFKKQFDDAMTTLTPQRKKGSPDMGIDKRN